MDYNREQRLAIEKRGENIGNILVSAGAGSGKTAVLAERVVSMICDERSKVDIDSLLIMTFTKNAASEMRERIEEKLKKRCDSLSVAADREKAEHIRKQISLLNRANITTIDSFCNNIVRQYFYKAGVDPGYKIAGDDSCRELARLRNAALEELFSAKFEENNRDFFMLLDYFCPESYNVENIKDIFSELDSFLSSVPFPEEWLESSLDIYRVGEGEIMSSKMCSFIEDYINDLAVTGEDALSRAASAMAEIRERYTGVADIVSNKKLEVYENVIKATRQMFDECIAASADYRRIYEITQRSLPALRGGSRNNPAELETVFDTVKEQRDIFKKHFWGKLKDTFASDPDTVCSTVKKHYRLVKELFALYTEYTRLYKAKKDENSVLSFSDINHLCVKILIDSDGMPSAEALEYRDRFAEVIVDEYQDNNMLQEYILKAITYGKNNLFMVGDIKQSIYGFRHACPDIFAEKYAGFEKDRLSEGDICICLNTNYRSKKGILDTVNFVFYQLMRSDFGGINYNEGDALRSGADHYTGKSGEKNICSEVLICSRDALPADEDADAEDNMQTAYTDELEKGEAEAHVIAHRIMELTDKASPEYVYDTAEGKYRPCTLSDIAILMRSANTDGGIYTSVLNRYGITTISGSRYSLFDELEVKTVMALLKVLDNPYREKELITVLHSPIFNVSCEELVCIKLTDKKAAMYDNILKYLEDKKNDPQTKQKLEKFMYINKQVSAMNLYKPFCEVLDAIYRLTDYVNYIGMIKNADMRIENLNKLSDMAREIYESGVTDFSGVVNQLCETEKDAPMLESAAAAGSVNAVRIMSIHKSKGLEFPVVFLAQMNKNIMRMGTEGNVITDRDMGIAFKDFDTGTRIRSPFVYRSVMSELKKNSSLAEELRLLYVAFTRARERIIAVGSVGNIDKAQRNWQQYRDQTKEGIRLSITAIKSARSYLDWLMYAYCRREAFNGELAKAGIEPVDIDEIMKVTVVDTGNINTDEFDTLRLKRIYDSIDPYGAAEEEKERLDRVLLTDYLDKTAAILPSKISVSEAKRQRLLYEYEQLESDIGALGAPSAEEIIKTLTVNRKKDTEYLFDDPAFLSENKEILYGAQRGTAYHTVFEHLDFDGASNIDSINAKLTDLCKQNILSKAELNSVDPNKFLAFLNSQIGKRACAAKAVYRETPFVMSMSPDDVFVEGRYGATEARLLVHGIVDMYFEENDGIVIVDYKTDRVDSSNTVQSLCEKYRIQLEFYRRAVEISSGKRVKQMYLYLVSADKEALAAEYI